MLTIRIPFCYCYDLKNEFFFCGFFQEDKLLKILNQLLHVNMTLDILQVLLLYAYRWHIHCVHVHALNI